MKLFFKEGVIIKILYCVTSSTWGGAQTHIFELCKDEIDRGNHVSVVVGNKGLLRDKLLKIPSIKVILMESLHRKINLVYDLKAIYELRKIITFEKPDIVHLHSSKAGTIGRLASIGLKTKVIFTVHGWSFSDGVPSKSKKVLYKFVEKVMSKFTDKIICVSNYDFNLGIKNGVIQDNKKAIMIHNGVEAPKTKNSELVKRKYSPLKFVMIARFSAQKDQKALINALSYIDPKKFELTFVGDGETLKENEKLVNELKISENVKFAGFKQDVSQYLLSSDVYVLTTHYEGLPISIIEAMSYGLPIIATNVGGNSELVINGENGYLINNKKELQNALVSFINNRELIDKMGRKSFEYYCNKFELQKCIKKINNLYKELVMN